ncbi:sporulation transcriptional regulator SpoIIID [bacterium]|nr:sporulation transcriptional regulator SpoIIID [bacterium]
MAKTFTEEERDKLIEQVGSYYLITKESYRDIAKEFGISAPTVKDYIEKYKKLHGHLAAEIDASIKEKTSQNDSINNPTVKERVITVYMYILDGYTIEEIATLLQEPISTIYNDINIRLEQVNPAYKEEVAAIMRKRSNQNLIPKQRKKD